MQHFSDVYVTSRNPLGQPADIQNRFSAHTLKSGAGGKKRAKAGLLWGVH